MVLFRWYDENTSLVALDMMTNTWNFVAKKIADGVNKFVSFFCLILIWCVCMIFSKISLVTSHRAFSTRLDFTAGNTPCQKSTNQRRAFTLSPVSWFSEQRKSKTPATVKTSHLCRLFMFCEPLQWRLVYVVSAASQSWRWRCVLSHYV